MDASRYEEISAIIAAYGRLLDNGEHEQWIDLFTADARFTLRGRLYVGREGLREFLAKRSPDPRTHFYGLATIRAEGSDTCSASGDFIALRPSDGGIRVSAVGRYHDRLRRGTDRWRFVERTIVGVAGF